MKSVSQLLHFQYHYPKGFSKADQNTIEEIVLRAKRTAAAKEIASYDDLSTAKYDWVLEVVSGAAPVFGRVAARSKWSPNQVRNTFRNYADLAAAAAQLTKPELLMFFSSQDWKGLDSALFPSTPASKVLPAKKRGRHADLSRRKAIRSAISKHGDQWRDYLPEIFAELDAGTVPLRDFVGRLDIPMHDPFLMGVMERHGGLPGHAEHPVGRD